MITFKIKLELKCFNLNQLTNSNRSGWAVGATQKKKYQKEIAKQIMEQKVQDIPTPCVCIAKWHSARNGFDIDNMLLKNVLDTLQPMSDRNKTGIGLLENDNNRFIPSIIHTHCINKEWQGVEIKFYEWEELTEEQKELLK